MNEHYESVKAELQSYLERQQQKLELGHPGEVVGLALKILEFFIEAHRCGTELVVCVGPDGFCQVRISDLLSRHTILKKSGD